MNQNKIIELKKPGEFSEDPLTELLRNGARQLISDAVEAELQELLKQYAEFKNEQGHLQIVRNGYLPERSIQTGIGQVKIKVPKIRDKSGQGIKFNSALLPPYLRKTKSVEEVLPWLYLKGISTGDFQEALEALLGSHAKGLSASTISRLKSVWEQEQAAWSRRSLASKRYVYIWADIAMPHPAQQIVLQEYIDTVEDCSNRVQRLTEQVRQQSQQSRLHELIKSLQSMRGISLIVAATIAAELGDLTRFENPEKLMAFIGLIPSEHSSGEQVKKGAITRTGNSHVRKALVEAAHAYRFPARKSRAIRKRQEELPKDVLDISWKAQCRLCTRYQYLTAKGKKTNVAKTAIAREIAGFSWAIAQALPKAA